MADEIASAYKRRRLFAFVFLYTGLNRRPEGLTARIRLLCLFWSTVEGEYTVPSARYKNSCHSRLYSDSGLILPDKARSEFGTPAAKNRGMSKVLKANVPEYCLTEGKG